jgi:hypothetical protein
VKNSFIPDKFWRKIVLDYHCTEFNNHDDLLYFTFKSPICIDRLKRRIASLGTTLLLIVNSTISSPVAIMIIYEWNNPFDLNFQLKDFSFFFMISLFNRSLIRLQAKKGAQRCKYMNTIMPRTKTHRYAIQKEKYG